MNLEPETAKEPEFIVGSEVRLDAILQAAEASLLLKAITGAGAGFAGIADEKGRFLIRDGDMQIPAELPSTDFKALITANPECKLYPLYIEGEPVGSLVIAGAGPSGEKAAALAGVALTALNIILRNTAKRIMAAELHAADVEHSYDELIKSNYELALSERKYRELAQTLEQKVEERTTELRRTHTRLLEQEKMAAIGQLAAGLAHEINNPTGFVYSNLQTFGRYIGKLQEMLASYRKTAHEAFKPEALKQAEELYEKLKIDFIIRDSRDLLLQSLDGAERIKEIVLNLKAFSHIDEAADRDMDLNLELDNTLRVLSHEIQERAVEVIKKYGRVPGFYGNPGLLCQAFLNILLNALQARESGLIITITTSQAGNKAVISIADNGRGIPPDVRSRIFEPFFTTKEVGKGTGMGLTVAYDIISGYGGSIEVKSEQDRGAEFIISLPLEHVRTL